MIMPLLMALAAPQAVAAAPPATAGPREIDKAGARKAVEHYLAGHATGDPAEFRAAFQPGTVLQSARDGRLATRTVEDYIAAAPGHPAADESRRRRSIVRLDLTATVGIAEVLLDYPNGRITDFLTLAKIGGEWRIVNKAFDVAPPTRTP